MPNFLSFKATSNSHVLKFLWLISNLLFWCLASIWSILLLFGLFLHFYLLPNIDTFRPRLEDVASDFLGTTVKIGAIHSLTNGFFPSLELLEVTNTDATGQIIFHLSRANATLSPPSVFRLSLDQLTLDGLELTAKRKMDGTVEIAGISLSNEGNAVITDSFFSIRDVSFKIAQLVWIDEKEATPPIQINDIDLSITNGIRDHQFRIDATPSPLISDRVNFRAHFKQPLLSLHPGQWRQWSGHTYFQTTHFSFSPFLLSFFPQHIPSLRKGEGWVRIWSEVLNGSFQTHLADFHLKDLLLETLEQPKPVQISSLAGRLQMAPWHGGQQWSAEQLHFSLLDPNDSWDLSSNRLALSNLQDPLAADSEGEIILQRSGVERLSKLMLELFPKSSTSQALSKLNFSGDLLDFKLSWGNVATSGESNILKGTLPSWIEHSKKIFNRLAARNKTSSSESSASPHAPFFDASSPFARIKHFRIEGSLHHLNRALPMAVALDSPSLSQTNSTSKKSSLTARSKPFSAFIDVDDRLSKFPHFKGLSAHFSFTEHSGSAQLQINNGFFELLGALEQPVVDIHQFSTKADWTISNGELDFHLVNGELKNASGSASFDLEWFNPDIFHLGLNNMGDIDLDASVASLDAPSLYKYLPLSINSSVRNYLKEAITSGSIQKAKFKIKGPLETLPYSSEAQGVFSIAAHLNRVGFNYFPKAFFKSPSLTLTDWPSLSELQGELQIKNNGITLKSPFANIGFDLNNVSIHSLEAKIANFSDPLLEITSDSRGSMTNYLSIFNRSSLSPKLGRPLEQAKSKGNADLKLKLMLPLLQIDRSKVLGNLTLSNNDIWLSPESPVLFRTRGALTFTESSLVLQNVQTHLLGGESKLEGGFRQLLNTSDSAFVIKASGTITSEGLDHACEIPLLHRIAPFLKGQTPYSSTVTIKKSGIPEILVNTNLQGMSLNGPAPFQKPADSILPMSFETSLLRDLGANHFLERQSISLGDQLALRLFKDSTAKDSTVLTGSMLVSNGAASLIQQFTPPNAAMLSKFKPTGWSINVSAPEVQLDDWQVALNGFYFNARKSLTCTQTLFDSSILDASNKALVDSTSSLPLPSVIKLQTDHMNTQGRDFHAVSMIANREGNNWSVNLLTKEASGTIKLLLDTEPSARRISAHLNQFSISPIKNKSLDPLLSTEEPFFPWLDVVIDNLQIKDHALGRVEFEAHSVLSPNTERFWRLNNLQLINPDASLKATANWSPYSDPSYKGSQSQIDLTLDISNAGQLLSRLGTPGVVKDGKGVMKGQLSWRGSLINPDFDSLTGVFNLDVEKGQFLKTDPGASRLLGVLNLQALPRRLTLDFKDLFGEGFAFDVFKGDIDVKDGSAATKNLIMKGVAGTVFLEGSANMGSETQDLQVVVVPEINAGTASLLYSTVNPIVGLTSFLAQYVIRQPLIQANTRTFHISGSWSDPQVSKIDIPLDSSK